MPEEKQINNPCAAYNIMAGRYSWDLLRSLLGSTPAMRLKKKTYLPMNNSEKPADYKARLARSFLFEALGDAIDRCVSKPFSQAVVIEGTPPELEMLNDNADGDGSTVHDFAEKCYRSGVEYGKFHILVDFPVVEENDPEKTTKKREQDMGLRPWFHLISAQDLFFWISHKDNGVEVLDEIRYFETHTTVGENETEEVLKVRVYKTDSWQLWAKNKKDEWEIEDQGVHTFGAVPLVTSYFYHTGFMLAKPVYHKLAWKNLEHWQSSSDQRNILHYTRLATLFLKGFKPTDVEGWAIGANRALVTENDAADASYVEIQGASISAGKADLDELQKEMENLGARPFVVRTNVTATSQVQSEMNAQTDIESFIRSTEQAFVKAYEMAGKWTVESRVFELPEEFKFNIFSDFAAGFYGSNEIDKIKDAYVAGAIDQETYLMEMKRRGILSENVVVEDVMDKSPGNPLMGGALGNPVFNEGDPNKKKDDE